jgi:hypothetical protein
VKLGQGRWGPMTRGLEATVSGRRRIDFCLNSNSKEFKQNSNPINFDRSKKHLFELQKFEIKYGSEGFEERNNFCHRNFFIFKMDFNLKIREASRFRI